MCELWTYYMYVNCPEKTQMDYMYDLYVNILLSEDKDSNTHKQI